jgi:hypothetical protein
VTRAASEKDPATEKETQMDGMGEGIMKRLRRVTSD